MVADSICGQCRNDSFELVNKDIYSFVQCKNCGNVVGTLENIDFNKRLLMITNNQVGLERLINEQTSQVQSELDEQKEKIDFILEVAEKLNHKL